MGKKEQMIDEILLALKKIKEKRPLIHHITNFVTANDQANITLSIGASPIMAVHPDELEEILARADALVLNTGTITPTRERLMIKACQLAKEYHKPVVLDPVGAGVSSIRKELVFRLLAEGDINVLKGNAAEIKTILGMPTISAGIDSYEEDKDYSQLASEFSKKHGLVTVISGEEDFICDGQYLLTCRLGNQMMSTLTGTGCMLASLIACFLGTGINNIMAATAGVLLLNLTAELAIKKVVGPGSLRKQILDEIYQFDGEILHKFLENRTMIQYNTIIQ